MPHFPETVASTVKVDFVEIMTPTHFCLGSRTAEDFENNLSFKLRGEFSAFGSPLDTPFNEIVIIAQSSFREWSKKPWAVQTL